MNSQYKKIRYASLLYFKTWLQLQICMHFYFTVVLKLQASSFQELARRQACRQ